MTSRLIAALTLVTLVAATPGTAEAAKPLNGIYKAQRVRVLALDPKSGKPLPSELAKVGRHHFLYTDSRGQVSEWKATLYSRLKRKNQFWLYSVDNANTRYHLTAALPEMSSPSYALLLGGQDFIVSTSSGGDNRAYTYSFRLDRRQADRAALIFGVPRKDRPDLGKDLRVSFSVDATRVGEPVVVKATITNIGKKPLVVPTGGAYRGSGRNNRFTLRVSYDGKVLPDIGRPNHFGGLGGSPTLAPGQSQTVQATVDKWARLDRDGVYELDVTYDLQAQLPRPAGQTRMWPSWAHEQWAAPRSGSVTFTLKP